VIFGSGELGAKEGSRLLGPGEVSTKICTYITECPKTIKKKDSETK
jgi:hypothetical protein